MSSDLRDTPQTTPNRNPDWIVCFGDDWGRHPSSLQQLARVMAIQTNILWIESLGCRKPRLNIADARRICHKVIDAFGPKKHARPGGVQVIVPLVIPCHSSRVIRKINRSILRKTISKALKRFRIFSSLVITTSPPSVDILDDIPSTMRVYYCADQYALLDGVESNTVSNLEKELLRKVDMVIATSHNLVEEKSPIHDDVRYLPHGVDYELFKSAAIPGPRKIAEDISHLKGPVIGFVGLIGTHIDLDLVAYAADQLSDATVLMIGPFEHGIEKNRPKRRNILYLGPRPRLELPSYLAHCDVCILPYAKNGRNKFANPVKVREYLAAGCPVVCTEQPEINNVSEFISIAKTRQEFVHRINIHLRNRHNIDKFAISKSMHTQSWSVRAELMFSMLRSGKRSERDKGALFDVA